MFNGHQLKFETFIRTTVHPGIFPEVGYIVSGSKILWDVSKLQRTCTVLHVAIHVKGHNIYIYIYINIYIYIYTEDRGDLVNRIDNL